MKLSDIKGERTFDVIAEIIDPIANIAGDDDAAALFKREKCPKGKKPREFMLGKIRRSVPKLFKEHKHDLVAIIAAIKDVEPDDYLESLNLAVLMADITELLTDEDFEAFLS